MKWVKRVALLVVALVVTLIALALAFSSPIARYVLEKYSKKWLGRQLTMTGMRYNLISGNFTVTELRVLEPNEKDVFIYADNVTGNFSAFKLASREIEFNSMKLNGAVVRITQIKNQFSFDDVILHFSKGKSDSTVKRKPMGFALRNFTLDSGIVYYHNKTVGRTDTFLQTHLSFPVFSNLEPYSHFHGQFSPVEGGRMEMNLVLHMPTSDYHFQILFDRFNLRKYTAALRSMLRVGSLEGTLDGKLQLSGSLKGKVAVAASGKVSIDSLTIRDGDGVVFTSLRKFVLDMDTMNASKNLFNFHYILFDAPYFKLDKYSNGTNLSRMLVKSQSTAAADDTTSVSDGSVRSGSLDYSNIFTLIWSYGKFIINNFTVSNYKADSLLLTQGHFIYNDYSLEDRFTYDISDLRIYSGAISSQSAQVGLDFQTILNHFGSLKGSFRSTPDFKHMTVDYVLDKIKAPDFNAYTLHYLATPFFDGELNYTAHIAIDSGYLKSDNQFNIIRLIAGKKVDRKPVYDWPVKLTVSLLKDQHGNIKLNIPVEGNLNDPQYNLWNVVFKVIENLFVKTVNSPAKLMAGAFGGNEEDLSVIPFDYLQRELEKSQFKKFDLVAKMLNKHSDLTVQLLQLTDTVAEREALALSRAKERYYLERIKGQPGEPLSKDDYKKLGDIKNQDSLFNAYLNEQLHISASELISTQEKSIRLIGFDKLEAEVQQLRIYRNEQVLRYLTAENSLPPARVSVVNNHDPLKSTGLPQPRYLVTYLAEE